jgi:hypothetical protein
MAAGIPFGVRVPRDRWSASDGEDRSPVMFVLGTPIAKRRAADAARA